MDKFSSFTAMQIFLNQEKKVLKVVNEKEKIELNYETSVFVGPNFITMKEALAIAGGKKNSKIVDKNGLCTNFLIDPTKNLNPSISENSCEFCIHSKNRPKTMFFKSRYYCQIGKGPDYTSPREFH